MLVLAVCAAVLAAMVLLPAIAHGGGLCRETQCHTECRWSNYHKHYDPTTRSYYVHQDYECSQFCREVYRPCIPAPDYCTINPNDTSCAPPPDPVPPPQEPPSTSSAVSGTDGWHVVLFDVHESSQH